MLSKFQGIEGEEKEKVYKVKVEEGWGRMMGKEINSLKIRDTLIDIR